MSLPFQTTLLISRQNMLCSNPCVLQTNLGYLSLGTMNTRGNNSRGAVDDQAAARPTPISRVPRMQDPQLAPPRGASGMQDPQLAPPRGASGRSVPNSVIPGPANPSSPHSDSGRSVPDPEVLDPANPSPPRTLEAANNGIHRPMSEVSTEEEVYIDLAPASSGDEGSRRPLQKGGGSGTPPTTGSP